MTKNLDLMVTSIAASEPFAESARWRPPKTATDAAAARRKNRRREGVFLMRAGYTHPQYNPR
jgi:hypothetical protein